MAARIPGRSSRALALLYAVRELTCSVHSLLKERAAASPYTESTAARSSLVLRLSASSAASTNSASPSMDPRIRRIIKIAWWPSKLLQQQPHLLR